MLHEQGPASPSPASRPAAIDPPARPGFVTASALASAAALGLLLAACGSTRTEWASEVRWKDLTRASLPTAAQYPEDGAVIVLDEGAMEVLGSVELGYSAYETHRIVKVFDSRGERFANVVVSYSEGSTVEDIEARTISPSGKITVLDPADVFDASLYPNFVFFSDRRAKLFTLPAVEPGAVLEYRYRIVIRDRTLWHAWTFQHDVPTLHSRFTLVKPGEWPLRYRTYGIEIAPRDVAVPQGFKSTTVWEARDIPPLRSEFAMPAHREAAAHLALAPVGFHSWDDVARWYHSLSGPRMKPGPEVERLAREIVSGLPDDRSKLRALFTWVRDRVRYLAVEIGIGGFQPRPAEDICSNLYGDCKDMVTVLCSMARAAGIPVYQALISTRQNGAADTALASPLHFNHVIAYAPSVDNGIWMDATEKGCPFGEIPWYDQGLPVLVVDESGKGEIMTTPVAPVDGNLESLQWQVALGESGGARITGLWSFTGAPASDLREELIDAAPYERRQWLERLLARQLSGVRLDTFSIAGMVPEDGALRIACTFEADAFGTFTDSTLLLWPGKVAMSALPDYFRAMERRHPVRLSYGHRRDIRIRVALPRAYGRLRPAGADSVGSGFGWSRARLSLLGRQLFFEGSYRVSGDPVPRASYAAFRSFLDAMRRQDEREAVLSP
jgi:hypothetical protein